VVEQLFALFGGGLRRIANRAARMQILRLPGERRRPLRGQPAKILFDRDGIGPESAMASVRTCSRSAPA